MPRLLQTIADAGQELGVGRSTLYELIASGVIKPVKIGRRTLIPHDELERYVGTLRVSVADCNRHEAEQVPAA